MTLSTNGSSDSTAVSMCRGERCGLWPCVVGARGLEVEGGGTTTTVQSSSPVPIELYLYIYCFTWTSFLEHQAPSMHRYGSTSRVSSTAGMQDIVSHVRDSRCKSPKRGRMPVDISSLARKRTEGSKGN